MFEMRQRERLLKEGANEKFQGGVIGAPSSDVGGVVGVRCAVWPRSPVVAPVTRGGRLVQWVAGGRRAGCRCGQEGRR